MDSHNSPTKEVILVRESLKDEEELDLLKLVAIFKRKWVWMVLPAVLVALAVGIYIYTRPRLYQAETTIVPPIELMGKASGIGSGFGGLQSSMLSSIIGGGSNLSEMYVGILQSRTLNERIVQHFDLQNVYEKPTKGDALLYLKSRTSIGVRKDGIIVVKVTDREPERASYMANAFVAELDQQNRRLSGGSATSKRKFLETRLKELQQELSSIDQLRAHEASIKEMIFETLSREYELARIEEAKSLPTIQVLDVAIAPTRGVGRGTIKKTIMAGMSTFIFMSLVVLIPHCMLCDNKTITPTASKTAKRFVNQESDSSESLVCEFRSQRQAVSSSRKKGADTKC